MRFSGKMTVKLVTMLLAMAMLVSAFGTMVFAADVNVDLTVVGEKYGNDGSNPAANAIDGETDTYMHITGGNSYAIFDLGESHTVTKVTASLYSDKGNAVRIVLSEDKPSDADLTSDATFGAWMGENTELTKSGSNFQSTTSTYFDKNWNPNATGRYITVFHYYSGEVYLSELEVYAEEKAEEKPIITSGNAAINADILMTNATMETTQPASNAVDGDAETFFQTDQGTRYTVYDMGNVYSISEINAIMNSDSNNPVRIVASKDAPTSANLANESAFNEWRVKQIEVNTKYTNFRDNGDNHKWTFDVAKEIQYITIFKYYSGNLYVYDLQAIIAEAQQPDDDEDDEAGVAKPGNVAYNADVLMTNATMEATQPASNAVDGKDDTFFQTDQSAKYAVYDMGAVYPIEKVVASIYSSNENAVKIALSEEAPVAVNLESVAAYEEWAASENVTVFNDKYGYSHFKGTEFKNVTVNYGVAEAPNARYITVFKYYGGDLYIKEIEAYKAAKSTVGYSSGTNYKNAPLQGDVNLTVGNRYEINKADIKVIMGNSALGQKVVNGEAFPYNVIDSDTSTTLTGSANNDMIILDLGKKYLIDSIDITYGNSRPNNQNYANYHLWYANEIPADVLTAVPDPASNDPYYNAFTALAEDASKAVRLGTVGIDDGNADWKTIDGSTVATSVSRSTKYRYVIIMNPYRALDIAEITVYGKQELSLAPEVSSGKVSGTVTGFSVVDAKTCQLMAVSYDADGVATKVSTMELGAGMEDGTAYSEDYSLDVDEDATDIKLFIWRNDGTLTPVVMPTEIG